MAEQQVGAVARRLSGRRLLRVVNDCHRPERCLGIGMRRRQLLGHLDASRPSTTMTTVVWGTSDDEDTVVWGTDGR